MNKNIILELINLSKLINIKTEGQK